MAAEDFKSRCADLLRGMGKTLAQISLYTLKHPTVLKAIEENHTLLDRLVQEAGTELTVSLDKDTVLVNGSPVSGAAQLPSALVNLFKRFELHGVTFLIGVSAVELKTFFEALTMKPDQFEGRTLDEYLASREVCQIHPNASLYAKVEKAVEGPVTVAGASAPAAARAAGAGLAAEIDQAPLEGALEALVNRAFPDAREAAKVREQVLKKLEEDIRRHVDEAVTELKRENTKLSNEKQRAESVVGAMSEAVVIVDDKGNVLLMNPAAEALYGKKLSELAGKPLADGGKPDEQLLALAREVGTPTDRPIDQTVEQRGADSAARSLKASMAAVRNEQGALVGMVTGLTDVAKFKEFERVQDEFIAQVTHELRSPLTSITAALSLLQQQFMGKLEPDQARMLGLAEKNSQRLATIINDILDFNKIQSGQLSVHPAPAVPKELLEEPAAGLEAWAKQKDVGFEIQAPDELPKVFADPKRVSQVLTNLLSNSIKLSPKGAKITLAARLDPDRAGAVVFSSQDRGPGMTQEEQSKLFGKFIQFIAGEKVGGTGLGLSIAKALVHLQKGEIWVESQKGAGTTFHFTLPIFRPEMIGEKPAAPPPPPPEPPKPWWQRLFGA